MGDNRLSPAPLFLILPAPPSSLPPSDFETAAAEFSHALEAAEAPMHAPLSATLHAERATARLRLKRYDEALQDCVDEPAEHRLAHGKLAQRDLRHGAQGVCQGVRCERCTM